MNKKSNLRRSRGEALWELERSDADKPLWKEKARRSPSKVGGTHPSYLEEGGERDYSQNLFLGRSKKEGAPKQMQKERRLVGRKSSPEPLICRYSIKNRF